MTHSIGYVLFLLLGVILGLMGTGGGIIIIPILVYFFHQPVIQASSYSLFIIGCTGALATIRYRASVDYKKGICFASTSMISIYLTRKYLLPRIPDIIAGITKDKMILYILSTLIMIASYVMINDHKYIQEEAANTRRNLIKLSAIGLSMGIIMGIAGIGGGFIAVPAFVTLLGMNMRHAVATSLFVVTLNSMAGLLACYQNITRDNLEFILLLTSITLLGVLTGTTLSHYISGQKLKKGFGFFIMSVGIAIILRNIFG